MILLVLIFLISRLIAQDIPFKHNWKMEYTEDYVKFTSLKKAPYPYSSTEEPQAIMYFNGSKLDKSAKNDLVKIVADEIRRIKNELSIDTYLEDNRKAKENIVSYFDEIENVRIAVIKYRFNTGKVGQISMPRNTQQVLFIHKDILWVSSLIVLYEADQNNMRSDQITILKKLIGN